MVNEQLKYKIWFMIILLFSFCSRLPIDAQGTSSSCSNSGNSGSSASASNSSSSAASGSDSSGSEPGASSESGTSSESDSESESGSESESSDSTGDSDGAADGTENGDGSEEGTDDENSNEDDEDIKKGGHGGTDDNGDYSQEYQSKQKESAAKAELQKAANTYVVATEKYYEKRADVNTYLNIKSRDRNNDGKGDNDAETLTDAQMTHMISTLYGAKSETEQPSTQYMSAMEAFKNYTEARAVMQDAAANVQTKAEMYANLLKANSSTGDPVEIATGNYLCNRTDMTVRSGAVQFMLCRNYCSSSQVMGSFGTDWICSADTRIIRGKMPDPSLLIEQISADITETQTAYTEIQEKAEEYKDYCDMSECLEKYRQLLDEENKLVAILQNIQKWNQFVDGHNQYTAYGRIEDNRTGFATLQLVMENGHLMYFIYSSEKQKWIPDDVSLESSMSLYSRGEDGTICSGTTAPGGFILENSFGLKRLYSVYGIPEAEYDRCGNKIEFLSEKGRCLQIILPGHETVSLDRDECGRIISASSSEAGIISFNYRDGRLHSVTDADGDSETYGYSSDGVLTSLGWDDGSAVVIEYNSIVDQHPACTSVINERGFHEYFDYDPGNRITRHIRYNGSQEEYHYDEKGRVDRELYPDGTFRQFAYTEKDDIASLSDITGTTCYEYDDKHNCIGIRYPDGSAERTAYNSFCQITAHIDRDGTIGNFYYDEHGNLIAAVCAGKTMFSASYLPNGLIASAAEGGGKRLYSYSYDGRGNMIERTVSCGRERTTVKYRYDRRNRVISYADGSGITTYTYSAHGTVTVYPSDFSVRTAMNCRKKIVTTEEIDTVNGERRVTNYTYNKNSGSIRCAINGILYKTVECNPDGTVASVTIWDRAYVLKKDSAREMCLRTIWTYNTMAKPISSRTVLLAADGKTEIEGTVSSWSVVYASDKKSLVRTETDRNGSCIERTFDGSGRLIKTRYPDDGIVRISYSPAGFLLSSINKFGGTTNYSYDLSSGFLSGKTDPDGTVFRYEYSCDGNLLSETDGSGHVTRYTYTLSGLMSSKKSLSGTTVIDRNSSGKIIRKQICSFDSAGGKICRENTYTYSGNGRTVTVCEGGRYNTAYSFDAWNQKRSEESSAGKIQYTYDERGNCSSITDGLGNVTRLEWHADGTLRSRYLPDGTVVYEKISNTEKTHYRISGNASYIADNADRQFIQNIDGNGRIIAEIDRTGNKTFYGYDAGNMLPSVHFPSGTVASFQKDEENGTVSTSINGKQVSMIAYDSCHHILSANTADENLSYTYDTGGHLVRQQNGSREGDIYYSYDRYGRCIGMKNELYEVKQTYTACGRLAETYDTVHAIRISASYDVCGRETERKFGNACLRFVSYDDKGRTALIFVTDTRKVVQYIQAIVYDEKERVALIADKEGRCTFFSYDEAERICRVDYPYNDEQLAYCRKECDELLMNTGSMPPSPEFVTLSLEQYNQLCSLFEKNPQVRVNIPRTQHVWTEYMTYDVNGNRKTKQNGFGTIVYDYDAENRIIGKRGSTSPDGGIQYSWNCDGCLVSVQDSRSKKLISCTFRGRAEHVLVSTGNQIDEVYCQFDALGRKIVTRSGAESCRTVYAGTSGNPIMEIVDAAGSLNTEPSVRYTDSKKYHPSGNVAIRQPEVKSAAQSGRRSFIYFNGDLSAVVDEEGTVTYLIAAYDGSIAFSTDGLPEHTEYIRYTLNGTPLQNVGCRNGFAGKKIDQVSCMYDFGARDYDPSIASFISPDPLRDGINWYSYCGGDPVNYCDFSGCLSAFISAVQKAFYQAHIMSNAGFSDYTDTSVIDPRSDCADTVAQIAIAAEQTVPGISPPKFIGINSDYNSVKDVSSTDFDPNDPDNAGKITKVAGNAKFSNKNIDVGTVFFWKGPGIDEKGEGWNGHVATVIAVARDSCNNITGIVIAEGHTGGHRTQISYIGSQADLKSYKGDLSMVEINYTQYANGCGQ